jgi:NAD(P)-dependent dehydrogenase (short-subunit alcohol dehydrogenase family)
MMTNKIAIITGGSRGLGRNTAVNLARHGVDILFTYRANQKEAESFIPEAEAIGRKAVGFRLDTGDVRALTVSSLKSARRSKAGDATGSTTL